MVAIIPTHRIDAHVGNPVADGKNYTSLIII